MRRNPARVRSLARLVVGYAAVGLALVVVLGLVLAASYRAEAQRRGVAEGLSEARLLAGAAIAPVLDGRPLADGLTRAQTDRLREVADSALAQREVLRLRLRDTTGHVVFSPDGSGFDGEVEDEAIDAAAGRPVALLTHVNVDADDVGDAGEAAVEVYLPLTSGASGQVVGVLETYLPYAPIDADVSAGVTRLYVDLAVGLLLLYGGILALAAWVSRGLRRQVRANRHLAEHDQLTDLPNRAAFLDRVRDALARTDADVAVAIVDLDRFKEVNDTLGHESGDELIAELARRLREHVRGRDCVARLGGDEFGIVLVDVDDPQSALWRVRELIEAETVVSGLPLSVGSSIGYAVSPHDGSDAEVLLQRADVALYVAKSRRGGVTRYSSDQDHYDPARLALAGELRRAIDQDELVLHYQPKIHLADGSVSSVEALVRWQHPTQGLLSPDRFIPLVEQTDLVDDLTRWVLHRALTDLGALVSEGAALSVAVNVSARTVCGPGLVALVSEALATTGQLPERLVLEMTETALLVDPLRAASALFDVADLGVVVSVDDFGVGQTSLSHLAALPIGEIKIDRSFVTDLDVNATHRAIARSVADLAKSLGVRVVVEGVETVAVADVARDLGCDLAQGWLYARALPIEQLASWLADRVEQVPALT